MLARYYAALQSGSADAIFAAVTSDIVVTYHDALDVLPWSGSWRGLDGLADFLQTVSTHLSVDQINVQSTRFADHHAIVHLRGSWTVRETERAMSAEVVNIFTFRDDKVAAYEVFPDSAAFAVAIGVLHKSAV